MKNTNKENNDSDAVAIARIKEAFINGSAPQFTEIKQIQLDMVSTLTQYISELNSNIKMISITSTHNYKKSKRNSIQSMPHK